MKPRREHNEYQPMSPRVREWREASGLTMGDLARRLGVCVVSVSDWERGRKNASWARARMFLELAGDALKPEDFGYVVLPGGRVARLLVGKAGAS